jgi:hypothetical protein
MTIGAPEIIIKKLIYEDSMTGVSDAERGLFRAVRKGIPSLLENNWPAATLNDIRDISIGVGVVEGGVNFLASYMRTRRTMLGPYLMFYIEEIPSIYRSSSANELPFFPPIVSAGVSGLISISQTRSDSRKFSVLYGRKSDIFSYLLGVLAGHDDACFEQGEDTSISTFPCAELAEVSSGWFEENGVVAVSGLGAGRFLRRCFMQLSHSITKSEFERRFARYGVYWRPRSPWRWLRHPL